MPIPVAALPGAPRFLLDAVRQRARHPHCSLRAGQAFGHRIRSFGRCHGMRHLRPMARAAVEACLARLFNVRGDSGATPLQSLSAILFRCRQPLGQPLHRLQGIGLPQRKPRAPA